MYLILLRVLVETRNKKENKNLVLLPGVELNVKFPNFQKDSIHFILIFDEKEYSKPVEITLQLTHKDVYLDFFKDKKHLILQLKSGGTLEIKGKRLYCDFQGQKYPVVQFSAACQEKIQSIIDRGYSLHSAKIRFIVAWRGENDEKESAIILPDIDFRLNE